MTKVHLISDDKEPSNTEHNMGMVLNKSKSNFVSQQWYRFHISFFMIFCGKMRQLLLKIATVISLQNAANVC